MINAMPQPVGIVVRGMTQGGVNYLQHQVEFLQMQQLPRTKESFWDINVEEPRFVTVFH